MTIRDFLDYEIRASWWASFVWWGWGRNLAGMWFAWKVKRKYSRYIDSRLDKAMAELMQQCKEHRLPSNASLEQGLQHIEDNCRT